MQQARNFVMWLEDEGLSMRFLIHDHDTKYTAKFDDFFRQIVEEQPGQKPARIIKSMIRVPQMTRGYGRPKEAAASCPEGVKQDAKRNGYAESFVASIKRELLNNVFSISLSQIDYLIELFFNHYQRLRSHQGTDIGNRVLNPDFVSTSEGTIKSKSSPGGLIRHDYREAT